MKKYLTVLLIIPSILFSQDNVSNEDLSKKLDLILQKIGGLEERVSKLESENTEVKREVKKVAKSAEEAVTATRNSSIPKMKKEKKAFSINYGSALKAMQLKEQGSLDRRRYLAIDEKKPHPITKLENSWATQIQLRTI